MITGGPRNLRQKSHSDRWEKAPSRYITRIRDRSSTTATIAVAQRHGNLERFINSSSRGRARDSFAMYPLGLIFHFVFGTLLSQVLAGSDSHNVIIFITERGSSRIHTILRPLRGLLIYKSFSDSLDSDIATAGTYI